MRRARHSAHSVSILLIAFAIALCATTALALPPKAEAAIHLGSTNTTNLTNGLVGYWPLDGATTNWNTNTTKDVSGNANNGSLAFMSTSTSPVGGKIGQGFKFKKTDVDYIRIPNSTSLDSITNAVTLSAWVKYNDMLDTHIVDLPAKK